MTDCKHVTGYLGYSEWMVKIKIKVFDFCRRWPLSFRDTDQYVMVLIIRATALNPTFVKIPP
jgi:hypothetical protein